MNINHLKAFLETVQASSISKAADILHLTQPAVSLQIQHLENSLGYKLLSRSNRGVQLTEYGKVFYSYAQSFITLWENLQHDLRTIENDDFFTLQIGTCPTIGQYALPCALYLFKQKYPQIRVSVQSLPSDQTLDGLRDHSCQIGFVEGTPDYSDLCGIVVLQTELVLIGPPEAKTSPLSIPDLFNLPLILCTENCDLRRALRKSLLPYGVDERSLKPFLELDGVESLKSTVRAGHGFSFLPYFMVKKELFTGELQRIEIKDVFLETIFSMVWRKEDEPTEAGKRFIAFIRAEGAKSFC